MDSSKKILFLTSSILFFGFHLYGQIFSEADTIFKVPSTQSELQMEIGDLNNDGLLDVVTNMMDTSNYIMTCILYNNGNGVFTVDTSTVIGVQRGDFKILDINRDNNSDLLIYGQSKKWNYASGKCIGYVSTESNNLSQEFSFTHGSEGTIDWGDISKNGYIDFAYNGVTATSTPWDQGYIYYGNEDGFQRSNLPTQIHGGVCAAADIDNDQDLDLYITGYRYGAGGDRPIRVYINNEGQWTERSFNGMSYPSKVAVRDMENTGSFDFVGLGGSSVVRMNSDSIVEYLSIPVSSSVDLGDFDNDGDLDILSLGSQGGIYRNINDLEFSKITGLQLPPDGGIGKWIDFDNDGDQDIILNLKMADGFQKILIYENLISVPNETPQAPENPYASIINDTVFLSWDRGSDFETPIQSLGYNIYMRRVNEIFMSPMADLATGHRKSNHIGNVGLNKGWHLSGLGYGTYYWGVQTLDNQFEGSVFAMGNTFVIPDFELTKKENCIGEVLRVNYLGDVNSEWEYIWDFDGAEIVAGTYAGPYNLIWNSVGMKTIKLEIYKNDTLIRETSDTVAVYNIPSSDFQVSSIVGIGEKANLSYIGNNSGGTFIWNLDGAEEVISGPGPHEISWRTIGQKIISLKVINGSGCSSIITKDTIMVNLIPNFEISDTVCANTEVNINFTGIGGIGSEFIWEFSGGEVLSGSGEGPFLIKWIEPGEKVVSLKIINGVTESQFKFDTIFIANVPDFDIGEDRLVCYSESLTITAPEGFDDTNRFIWNNIIEKRDYQHRAMSDTMITLDIINTSECIGSDTFFISVAEPYDKEKICIVTVNKEGKNLIVWEPSDNIGIQQYNIYKELNQAGVFSMIGYVPTGQLSLFVDENSDPSVRSNRYKLAVVDTCGNESIKSPFHKTIYLAVSPGVPTGNNLSWDHIEIEGDRGEYSTYFIYRGKSYESLELIQQTPSNNNQIKDPNPPDGDLYYQISAIKLDACTPKGIDKKNLLDNYGESFSNVQDIGANSYKAGIFSCDIHIYPNPFTESTIIEFANPDNKPYRLIVTDLSGKIVREEGIIGGERFVLNRKGIDPGIYFIELQGANILKGRVLVF